MPPENHSKKRIRPVVEEILDNESLVQESPVVTKTVSSMEEKTVDEEVKNKLMALGIKHPEEMKKDSSIFNLGFFAIVVLISIIVALSSGALYVYFNGLDKLPNNKTTVENQTPAPTAASVATATPIPTTTPTPKPSVAKDKFKISILNGSGKIGEAGVVKKIIEDDGFVVSQTGNAQSFSFKTTLIEVKESVSKEIVDRLKEVLGEDYPVEVGKENLSDKSSWDIIITVGSQ